MAFTGSLNEKLRAIRIKCFIYLKRNMMVGGRGAQVLVDLLIFLFDIIGLNDIFRLIDFE